MNLLNATVDKLQGWLKTDVRYLLKGGSWLAAGQFFSSLSVLLLSIAFANFLDKDTYGLYKYTMSIVAILSIFTLAGMDTAIGQAVARKFDGSLFSGFREKMRWGAVGSLIAVAVAGYYYLNGNSIIALSLFISAVFIPLTNAYYLYSSLLSGRKLFKLLSIYAIITQVSTSAIMIAVLFLTRNIILVILAYFVSNTFFNYIFFKLSVRIVKPNNDTDESTLIYGRHLSIIDILNTGATQIDKILIFQYLGAADLAIYTFAVAPTEQIKGLLKNIQTLAMPKFAVRSKEEIGASLPRKLLILGILVLAAAMAYIISAPLIFKILFPSYMASVPYSQVLAISLVPATLSSIMYTVLRAQSETESIYRYNIYSNIFSIIVLFPAIYFGGIMGAILTRIATRFFLLMLSYRLVKKA